MLNRLTNNIWLMEPERLIAMHRELAGVTSWPTPTQLHDARELAAKQMRKVSGRVAVLPVYGVIEQRISEIGFLFGGFSTELAETYLSSLLANKEVDAVVLDIDSPGGTSYGVEELSDLIYEGRKVKPIYAIANSMACSAAFWIATAASSFSITPGGDTGSLGVYMTHGDMSGMLTAQGVKVTTVKAGKYKAELSPYEPLSMEAKDHMQEMVDATYKKFVGAVARNRGVAASKVKADYGQGRLVMADEALGAGMVDKVLTFSQLMEKLTGSTASGMRAAGELEVLRLRHAQQKRRGVA